MRRMTVSMARIDVLEPPLTSPMTDILTKAERSALMAKVKGWGNASTELRLVAVFRALGISGWRRGVTLRIKDAKTNFKVKPDFVFRGHNLAVFVDGCFWHGCPIHATRPRQNAQFWREKIAANQARDRLVTHRLRAHGWRVLRIWEHELTKRHERRLLARLGRIGLLNLSSGTKRDSAATVAPSPARPRKSRPRLKG